MKALFEKIRKLLRDKRVRKGWYRIVSGVAAAVVFVTTYALVLPAITIEKMAECGIEEHQHDDGCYADLLICGQEEGEDHHHTADCFERALVCGKEAHTHSENCYKTDGGSSEAAAAGTLDTADSSEDFLEIDSGSAIEEADQAVEDSSAEEKDQEEATESIAEEAVQEVVTDSAAEKTDEIVIDQASDGYVPELAGLNMRALFDEHTGFYYFHAEEDVEIPDNSAEITDWKRLKNTTELTPNDLVKMYLSFQIPAGSLNETNPAARYRLPDNIHLTDDQIEAINNNENGLAAGFEKSSPDYRTYLGAEAVEGDRRPDEILQDGSQEYISAVVKAENVFDEDGQYLGQDLIFVFTPYTIEQNRNTYDGDGNQLTAGTELNGWFACDFNLSQIDWAENGSDSDDSAAKKTAEVILVEKDDEKGIEEIRAVLNLTEAVDVDAAASAAEEDEEEETVYKSGTLEAGGDGYKVTIDYTEDAKIPENASLSVHEITAETDQEAYQACLQQASQQVAETADDKTSVDEKATRFFDIEILVKDTEDGEQGDVKKIEPAAPVSVNIQILNETDSSDSKAEPEKTGQSDPAVLHFAEEGVELIDSSVEDSQTQSDHKENGTEVRFEAESFSIYGLVYTVDFHWEVDGKKFDFSLPGGGFVSLEKLMESLGITEEGETKEFVADVEKVDFSNPDLVWVEKIEEEISVGALKEQKGLSIEYSQDLTKEQIEEINSQTVDPGDWALISLRPFETEESLTVTMKDGEVFTILITDAQIQKTVISASGETYEITVTYGEDAKIPDGSELNVREILPEDREYMDYYQKAMEKACGEKGRQNHARQNYARLFDIEILDQGEKIEPQNSVAVSITLKDSPDRASDLRVVHFGSEKLEILETQETEKKAESPETSSEKAEAEQKTESQEASMEKGRAEQKTESPAASSEKEDAADHTEVKFMTDEFSVYAVVSTNNNNGYGLGGQKFAIVNTNVNEAVLGKTQTQSGRTRLAASAITVKENNDTDYVIGDEVTVWEFVSVNGNTYNIKAPDGRYMNITGEGTATLSNNPQNITVNSSGNAGLRLSAPNGYALNAWNDRVSDGFGGGNWNNASERFTLFDVDEVIQTQADKISLTELVNKHVGETPLADVVIYTRILNTERDGYDYYAVASDGSLVPISDLGNTVGWTASEDTSPARLKWNLTVHRDGGEHNGYFDFQSMETGRFLIPTAENGLKEDDPEEAWDLGVNMQGWNQHTYGSTIERWDDGSREYVGYAYDPVSNKIVPTIDDTQKLEFLFAQVNEDTTPDQLHEVPTLDGKTKGITIRMYDFDGYNLYQTYPARSREMTNVLGTGSIQSTNEDGVGYANRGLVSQTLTNGFPTATLTGRSLNQLFNDAHLRSDASNIFVRQVYDETGYFSYDSSINYAYLDQGNDQFILYQELAAPEMEGRDTPSANKGNFFPFDSLQALADQNKVFTDRVVQYDGDLQLMSPDNPLYGKKLYVIDSGEKNNYKSYFFGMTMEAQFYQGPDGKDEKGNDIIYEFNGDDDMWLYIDDRLMLDIGGCHGAVSGTINFATGEVKVNGAKNQVHTTIKQIFQDAGKLPDGTDWTEKGAGKWFKGDTFADYTKHSFKMFYMERGSYASNLKMKFNLLTIEPGSFVLEKKLPANVQSAYGDQVFAYQIYTIQNGREVLYTPPAGKYVTYEKTGERVVPEGQTESAVYKPTYEIDGRTFNNVYLLKPDEPVVIPTENNEVRYYVREIGIDTDLYESVWANQRELNIEEKDGTHIAQTGTDAVKTRGRVTYENIPKEVHNLRLEKLMQGPLRNPDDSFRFDVKLEDSRTGQLVPFNQGRYYIVKTENGVDRYYKYENGALVQSNEPVAYKAGLSGSIDRIQPGYTILITGLLPGTDFKVTENQSEAEFPAGYAYVKTEVKNAGEPEADGSDGTILARTAAGAAASDEQDALVQITNTSDLKTDIEVEKTWNGNMPAGKSTIVLYKVTGSASDPDVGKPGSKVRIVVQADPAPVTTDAGSITVHYTGTKKDGSEDSGSFTLSNEEGWSKPFEFDRGGEYSFTYSPDGTKVLTAVPDKTGTFSESDTITLTTTAAELQKFRYTFSVPEDQRQEKGSVSVTCNGITKTADHNNHWTVVFEVAEETPVAYSAQPDGKFITGAALDPATASPAVRDRNITITPEKQALTMVIPVSVDWSQSTTSLPDDTAVTFKITGNGREETVVLPSGNSWETSITLDRLDENGDLITYSVESSVTTADTKKTVSLGRVPVSISGSGEIAAKGIAKSKGIVAVTVQRVQYWSDTGYNFLEALPVQEFEPGDTITVKINRLNNPYIGVSYRTSDGKSGTIDSTQSYTDFQMHEESFDITLPDTPGNYTINVDDPWTFGASLVSVQKKTRMGRYSVPGLRSAVKTAPMKAAPTHIASPEQTFYDAGAGGSGDLPFTVIKYKDLPAGAVQVSDSEVPDSVFEMSGNGSHKWENLSTIDENGNPIYYYVVERDATAKADEMSVSYHYTYRDDGTIEKVEIVNTANGREEPDTKNFAFTKAWRDMLGESAIAWPSGISITVTIQQDENEYAKYTITSADLQENNEISAVGDSAGSKAKLIVRTSKISGYVFNLTGLPWGDSDTGYIYRVSEEAVAGFQPPKYFGADGEQAMGASRIEDGGSIMNDEIGYELPSTGGPGTGLFKIPGLILTGLAGALLVTRRRRRV